MLTNTIFWISGTVKFSSCYDSYDLLSLVHNIQNNPILKCCKFLKNNEKWNNFNAGRLAKEFEIKPDDVSDEKLISLSP
jgi:hypothetical protein